MSDCSKDLMALTAQVVSAYVGHNSMSAQDLPVIINAVYNTLSNVSAPPPATQVPDLSEPLKPAVPVRKSVAAEHIVCLECGQRLKLLKRHLMADHAMTPESYRVRWNLPPEYPMVAPDYARTRSEMAVKFGLGRRSVENEGG
ncbi:Transcriptional regulatory protein RosR [Azospirillaceae bacterium]